MYDFSKRTECEVTHIKFVPLPQQPQMPETCKAPNDRHQWRLGILEKYKDHSSGKPQQKRSGVQAKLWGHYKEVVEKGWIVGFSHEGNGEEFSPVVLVQLSDGAIVYLDFERIKLI